MYSTKSLRILVLLLVVVSAVSNTTLSSAKTRDKKQAPRGTPVLWRQPADIATRNLYLGPGGAAMRPDLRNITFL
jgi:hypothetical protein